MDDFPLPHRNWFDLLEQRQIPHTRIRVVPTSTSPIGEVELPLASRHNLRARVRPRAKRRGLNGNHYETPPALGVGGHSLWIIDCCHATKPARSKSKLTAATLRSSGRLSVRA